MKKLVVLTLLLTAGCASTETSRTMVGALAGAAIADDRGGNSLIGAAIGGAAGAASCQMMGGCY